MSSALRSCNEVQSVIVKAARAAGHAVDVAADAAAAALLLAAHGYNGLGAAAAALLPARAVVVAPERRGEVIFFADAGAAAGMMAAEMLYAERQAAHAVLQNIQSPLLLAGQVALAASRYQTGYVLTLHDAAGGESVINSPAASALLPSVIEAAAVSAELRINSAAVFDAAAAESPLCERIKVDEEEWRQLEALAAEIYVTPTGESRRQGAGAGEIDND